jgi:hypothetical protein
MPPGRPSLDPVPPRPDVPQRSRSPLLGVLVVACVLAVVLGVLAIGALLRDPVSPRAADSPSATASSLPTPSPSAAPTHRPEVDGAYKFLERVGGEPVRWNPCDPISYAVNTAGASSSIRSDLREALARVTRAAGIEFESVGTTEETFFRAYNRMRYRGVIRKAELIIIWVDHDAYRAILRRLQDPRPSIAFAKTMAGLYADRDQYFGGIIVIDADATAGRGFGYRYAHGSVLLHELGHIMGLDHVKDPDQLMYSGRHPDFGVHGFGAGDLEGLRRLGAEAGCLD